MEDKVIYETLKYIKEITGFRYQDELSDLLNTNIIFNGNYSEQEEFNDWNKDIKIVSLRDNFIAIIYLILSSRHGFIVNGEYNAVWEDRYNNVIIIDNINNRDLTSSFKDKNNIKHIYSVITDMLYNEINEEKCECESESEEIEYPILDRLENSKVFHRKVYKKLEKYCKYIDDDLVRYYTLYDLDTFLKGDRTSDDSWPDRHEVYNMEEGKLIDTIPDKIDILNDIEFTTLLLLVSDCNFIVDGEYNKIWEDIYNNSELLVTGMGNDRYVTNELKNHKFVFYYFTYLFLKYNIYLGRNIHKNTEAKVILPKLDFD